MKRIAFAVGVVAAVMAAPALAADPACPSLLSQAQPVSPYVQLVLDRATAGIAEATSAPAHANFAPYLPSWVRTIDTSVRGLVDTNLRIVEQQRDLPYVSGCLHLDHALLQCKIDQVTQEIHAALERGSWGAIWRLLDLLTFLKERESVLLGGALDTQYRDTTWSRARFFDPQGSTYARSNGPEDAVCGDGMLSAGEECDDGNTADDDTCSSVCKSTLCPFSSDYASPGVPAAEQFGCDASVMSAGNRLLYPPLQQEYQGWDVLFTEFAAYRQSAIALSQDPNAATGTPQHRSVTGCLAKRGHCDADNDQRCSEDNDCLAIGGPCVIDILPDVSLTAPHSPFSTQEDHWNILQTFRRLWQRDGLSRMQRRSLRFASEVPEDDEDPTIADDSVWGQAFVPLQRMFYRSFSGQQGVLDAGIFATSIDKQLTVLNAFTELRNAAAPLATMAKERTGIRGFTMKLAAFLLRTCMDRPCSLRLQHIFKVANEDECFPYVSGAYLTDTCSEPRWKKCIDAIKETESGYSPDASFDPFGIQYPAPVCE